MEERWTHHTIKGGVGVGVDLNTPVTLRMNDRLLLLKAVQGRHVRKPAYLSL